MSSYVLHSLWVTLIFKCSQLWAMKNWLDLFVFEIISYRFELSYHIWHLMHMVIHCMLTQNLIKVKSNCKFFQFCHLILIESFIQSKLHIMHHLIMSKLTHYIILHEAKHCDSNLGVHAFKIIVCFNILPS